jgi:hypothetical protein
MSVLLLIATLIINVFLIQVLAVWPLQILHAIHLPGWLGLISIFLLFSWFMAD